MSLNTLALALSALVLSGGSLFAQTPPTEIHVRLLADGHVLVNGRHNMTIEEFSLQRLPDALKHLKTKGFKPFDCRLILTGEEKALAGSMVQLVQNSQRLHILKYVLHFSQPFAFEANIAAPAAGLPDENAIPPMRLVVKAKPDGSVDRILLNATPIESWEAVQQKLSGIVGDDRGPGSIFEVLELAIDADPKLHWRHLGDAFEKTHSRKDADGKSVPLAKTVVPARVGAEKSQIFETVDEFEEMDLIPAEDFKFEVEPPPAAPVPKK